MESKSNGLTLQLLLKINAVYIITFTVGLVFGGAMFLELIGYESFSGDMNNVSMWLGVAVFGIALMNWTATSFVGENLNSFGRMQVWVWVPFILINIYTLATGVIEPGANMATANMVFGPIIAGLLYTKSKA